MRFLASTRFGIGADAEDEPEFSKHRGSERSHVDLLSGVSRAKNADVREPRSTHGGNLLGVALFEHSLEVLSLTKPLRASGNGT
jgi:hypothetical protein